MSRAHEPEEDLVAELRRIAEFDWRVPVSQVVAACRSAAAEIERLRREDP